MPAPKIFKYQVIADVEKALAAQNKLIAKHQQELQILKEKVKIGQRVDKANRSAGKLASGFGRVFANIQLAGGALRGMAATLEKMSQFRLTAFEGLKKEQSARTALRQITETPAEFESLLKTAAKVAQTQSITPEAAMKLTFEALSRGFTQSQIEGTGSLRGIVDDPSVAFNIAADLRTAFGKEDAGNLRQAVSAVLVGSVRSKVRFESLASLLLRPSQAAKNVGLGLDETIAAVATAVGGVQDPSEASTAIRALFQAFKAPQFAAVIKSGGLLGAIDLLAGLTKEQRQALTPDVREELAAGLLVENREKIREDLKAIRKARELAGTGFDEIDKRERTLQFDTAALGPLLAQQKESAKSFASRGELGVPGSAIKASRDVLTTALAEAYGDSFFGKIQRVVIEAVATVVERGPFGGAIQVVESMRTLIPIQSLTLKQIEKLNESFDVIGDNLINALSERERGGN